MPSSKSNLIIIIIIRINLSQFRNSDPSVCSLDFFVTPLFLFVVSVPRLIVHSELKSVHPGFPVAFIFKHKLINK